jgi:HD-GYP domain-containing protein (c-di-GMP phosphodiesterase class II)
MLKKIRVEQLQLGMYLHAFEGAWVDHPFWRTRFLIKSPADLEAIRASPIRECWIDVAQGDDVAGEPSAQPDAPPAPAAATPTASPAASPAAASGRVSLTDELQRARQVRDRLHAAVQQVFAEARLGRLTDASACLPLVHDAVDSVMRHGDALTGLVRLKLARGDLAMHGVAVCALMATVAEQIGLSVEEAREAAFGGLLMDLGKVFVPPELLDAPRRLSPDELTVLQRHVELGHAALSNLAPPVGPAVLDICLHHHERVDGSGYPHGLFEDQLSLYARMAAVCDVYAALTAPRAYRAAVDPPIALQWMAQWKSQFDPLVFQALVRAIGIYPVGSLVRLQSGRLAVVVEQNPRSLMAPQVRSFYSARAQVHLEPELIDLSRPHCNERIVQREQAAHWGFKHLDKLWAGDAAVA